MNALLKAVTLFVVGGITTATIQRASLLKITAMTNKDS